MTKRVVLAMSGGVDSSVAAALLKESGHDVVGLFMRTGADVETERKAKTCCSAVDALDAQNVADRLDIPFYVLDFERDFARIQEYFADEYLAGRTPNPCAVCNIWLKFGKLWDYGRKVGAGLVATGHYARVVTAPDGTPRVARGIDRAKDQSYVLFGLTPEILPSVLLPIGDYSKDQIRRIARERGLPVHDKPDSQEICFIPDDDYLRFVRGRRPLADDRGGEIVDTDGRRLATHAGVEAFTIGQRRGLGLAVGEPRYVVSIEPLSRTVTVGPRTALASAGLEASRFNWQGPAPEPGRPLACFAQIRARHQAVPATVLALEHGRARVVFESPQPAVAPGQIITVYEGDLVLGGGWIDQAIPDIDHS